MKIALMAAAGYGMFRLLRDWLGFAPDLAVIGGAVFAFNSQTQVVTIIHAVFNFAFPLVFVWALGRGPGGGRAWAAAAAGLVALSLVSYPVLTGPEFATLGLLLIVFLRPADTSAPRALARWAVFWLGYALVFLPLVHGLLGFKDESQRTYFPGTAGPLTMLVNQGREAMVGSLIVVLIGGALALLPWSPAVRRALAVAGIPVVLSAVVYSTWGNAVRETFLGKLEIHLLYYVHGITFTLLGMIGLREVLARRDLRRAWLAGGAVAFVLVMPPFLRGSPWAAAFLLNLLVPLGVWLALRPRTRWLTAVVVAVALLVRVHVFHEGQEDTAYRRFFQRDPALVAQLAGRPARAVTLGFHPSLGHNLGLETADGYSALFSARYREVWRRVVAGQLDDPRAAARFDWYWVEISPLNGQTLREFGHRLLSSSCPTAFERPLGLRLPLLLAMNVDTVLALRPVPELEPHAASVIPGRCTEPWGGPVRLGTATRFFAPAPVWVYRLRDALPRGWAVDRMDVLPSDAAVLDALGTRSLDELRRTVVLSAADGHAVREPRTAPAAASQARLVSYAPDRIVFDVDAAGPAWVVVANIWSRHWRATVDGAPAAVVRANHAFQAVAVAAAGRRTVVFEYHDRWLWPSYAAIPFGLIALVAAARPSGRPRGDEA